MVVSVCECVCVYVYVFFFIYKGSSKTSQIQFQRLDRIWSFLIFIFDSVEGK